jgi:cytochrome b
LGATQSWRTILREMSSEIEKSKLALVRVWDLPVRLTHWVIALLVLLSWWSAEYNHQNIHTLSGYAVLALAILRIYWGIFGSTTARFRDFVRGPRAIWAHARQVLKRPGITSVGHNPMGALSVIVLLGLLFAQPALGLFAKDIDGLHSGPLSHLVGYDTGRFVAELHHLVFELLLIFIVLHLAAVAFYVLYKRDGIVSAMISGTKRIPEIARRDLSFVPARHAAFVASILAGLLFALHLFGSVS